MIQYPILQNGTMVGVTAPSSGVPEALHDVLRQACARMEARGYRVVCGETAWTQERVRSADASKRAAELQEMMDNPDIGIIIPPWGGELLIEMLEYMDWQHIVKKWVLGYSDVSALLLAITLRTGIATAHGTNFVDIRGEQTDETTGMWETVLQTKVGGAVTQHSSMKYQTRWQHGNPTPHVFHLTEPTEWKTVSGEPAAMSGRLLGGCVDIIRHLIGTPFGDVAAFRRQHIPNEPVLWYLENCELAAVDLRRSLVHMKLAGWFDNCAGMLFGRNPVEAAADGYTAEEVYRELAAELGVPFVYDIDCGHMPPQLTFVNGAFATVTVADGKGTLVQEFRA